MHAPLDELRAIPQTARFYVPSAFAISPICTICYFAGAVQDCLDGLRSITLQNHSCTATLWEMSLCVIAGLVAQFAARKRVLLLNESNMGALSILDRLFVGRSHLIGTVVEVLTCQNHYRLFDSNHYISEVDPYTGETRIWIHVLTFTLPDPVIPSDLTYDHSYILHLPCG